MRDTWLVIAWALVLAGCETKQPAPILIDFPISIAVNPQLEKWGESRAHYKDGQVQSCEIILKRYPACLLHEIRHCIEGDWHPRDEPNTEDC